MNNGVPTPETAGGASDASDGTAEWSSVELANAVVSDAAQPKGPRKTPALVTGLVGAAALFAVGATSVRSSIERSLSSRSAAALLAGGQTAAVVSYSGRDATVRVPKGADAPSIHKLIRTAGAGNDAPHYSGPRTVNILVDSSQAPMVTTTTIPVEVGSVTATRNDDGTIVFTGAVESVEAKEALRTGAAQQAPASKIELRTETRPGGVNARTATWIGRSIGELSRVGASTARVSGNNSGLVLSGAVPTLAVRDAVNAFVRTSGLPVTGSLAIVRPPDTRAAGPGPDLFGDPAVATGALQAEIDSILTESIIQFSPDSARITRDSSAVVEKLAELLVNSPTTRVEIIGHTDTNGSAEHNLALSVARADAVRDKLVEAGVAAGRITTLGEGGAKPLVSNDTPANRRKNRRIEIKISEG